MTQEFTAAAIPAVDILVQSPLWDQEPQAKEIVERAVTAAAQATSSGTSELAVVLTDDATIRILNRKWRNRDAPTNVLSFPASNAPMKPATHLGDIVIAFETSAGEAMQEAKPFAHHLAHLTVHGYLHLLGYDHEISSQAEAMEGLESAILARLGVPSPYATDREQI